MKKIILSASAVILFALGASAQECGNFFFLQQNKSIELTIYNRKGDVSGKSIYNVRDVKKSGGFTTSNWQSEMFDKKGKSLAKGAGSVRCNGGVMYLDLKMMLGPAQQQQMGDVTAKSDDIFMEYPSSMKVGDQLKDATMHMDIENKGMKQSVNVVVNNRKVEGKESVNTTAGTWDCFKITYKSKIHVKMMGIGIPVNIDGTEWYAPGFGVVKTESKHGTTAITSIK